MDIVYSATHQSEKNRKETAELFLAHMNGKIKPGCSISMEHIEMFGLKNFYQISFHE